MKSFKDMPLPIEIQKALTKLNFTEATPIQESTIQISMDGKDMMACAETGSGKTAAYAIPAVASLIADKNKHVLILAPTRELAVQIADFCRDLIAFTDGISVTALIGGADIQKQFRSLKKNPRILVATPGRLNDHLNRKSVKLDKTEILVLDEGDRMLDMGFAPQLDEILKFLPKKRQTALFTATLPEKVKKLAQKYLNKPEQIAVGRVSLPVSSIEQTVVEVSNKQKEDRLVDELNKRESSIIIFAKTKIKTDRLARSLKDYGFKVNLIHGGRSQGQRNRALADFKSGKSRILCATDVAARGIDIPSVAHVINYDLPTMVEDYVHRIGRTARNGASGEAVSFVTPDEHRTWNAIAKKYKIVGVELKGKSEGGGNSRKGRGPRSSDRSRGDGPAWKLGGSKFGSKRFGSGDSSRRSFKDDRSEGSSESRPKRYGSDTFGTKKSGGRKFGTKKFGSGDSPKRSFGEDKSEGSSESRPKKFSTKFSSDRNSGGKSGGKKFGAGFKKSSKSFGGGAKKSSSSRDKSY